MQTNRTILVASGGPVTVALAAMRVDIEPAVDRLMPAPFYPWPDAMERPTRAEIEAMIEGLIEYLDREDGDADLEPALASPEPYPWHGQILWAAGGADDRENAECVDCDGELVPSFDPRKGLVLSAGRR